MPRYDDWDSLFYCLWYQPGHVNLAYTPARKIPADRNPFLTGEGSLRVIDFGCGALAAQFGLALAAADTLAVHGKSPQITVELIDTSESMKSIGWAIWSAFLNEIEMYPELSALRRVCDEMRFGDGEIRTKSLVWLTALHVAYKKNAPTVKSELADIIGSNRPEIMLATTHKASEFYAFRAESHGYSGQRSEFIGADLEFKGILEATTSFRYRLYDKIIGSKRIFMPLDAHDLVGKFLRRHATTWTTFRFSSVNFLYTKR